MLLVVLDTVRADRLSLYGYSRPMSPALDQLGRRGIRFDEARATAPWTLPSHASMFTGRWPFELDVRWATPLRGRFPTVAEYLASHGYATAGFAANTAYCSYDTGLDRGFTHFEDYGLDVCTPQFWRMASLADLGCGQLSILGLWLTRSFPAGRLHARLEPLLKWLTDPGRKNAGSINRNFLDWLSYRRDQDRPFFAFLNYFDAHSPYLPPEGAGFRFGVRPRTLDDYLLLIELWITIDKSTLTPHYRDLISDCYDSCLAYLDQRLGELFDNLQRRGVLDRTVVIVTADHGEELGEHRLFDHGESLYRPEIRVPLLFVLPSALRPPVGRDKNRGRACRRLAACARIARAHKRCAGYGEPPRLAGDDRRIGRPGARARRSPADRWPGCGATRHREPLRAVPAVMVRSPSCRFPIRSIRIKVVRPLVGAHWSAWRRGTMFISATRGMGGSSYFTSASIRTS